MSHPGEIFDSWPDFFSVLEMGTPEKVGSLGVIYFSSGNVKMKV